MSEKRQLAKKLAALTEDALFEGGAMRLGPGGDREALALILEAIDNTVLPRKLTFTVDGASVTLAVGGRRLSSVLATNGPVKADAKLVGTLLSNSETKALTKVHALLESVVTRNGAVMLTREEAEGRGGQSDTGVGVATLAEAWDIDPYAAALPRAERLIRSLGDDLVAHGRVEDSALKDEQGAPKIIKALTAILPSDILPKVAELDDLHKAAGNDRCVTLEGLLPEDMLVSFVNVDGDTILLATVSDAWPQISVAWSKG
jgi:hypothetical protein